MSSDGSLLSSPSSNSITSEKSIKNTPVEETEEFLEQLNEYYKLKNIYETKHQSQINNILTNTDLSMKQKQEKYKKLKMKCINCARNVGTIFGNDDGILTAICGDKIHKCQLDIKINRGKFISLEELIDVYQSGVNDLKEEIIMTKLDMLFNYETESNTLTKFNKLKGELAADLESVMEYKTKFIEVVSNLDNKTELTSKMTGFYNKISLIKSSMSEFNETSQIQLIKDVIILYEKELLPLLNELRNLNYKYMAVEHNIDTNTHKLVRKVFTLQDLIISFNTPNVESFVIGTTKQKQNKLSRNDDVDSDIDSDSDSDED